MVGGGAFPEVQSATSINASNGRGVMFTCVVEQCIHRRKVVIAMPLVGVRRQALFCSLVGGRSTSFCRSATVEAARRRGDFRCRSALWSWRSAAPAVLEQGQGANGEGALFVRAHHTLSAESFKLSEHDCGRILLWPFSILPASGSSAPPLPSLLRNIAIRERGVLCPCLES